MWLWKVFWTYPFLLVFIAIVQFSNISLFKTSRLLCGANKHSADIGNMHEYIIDELKKNNMTDAGHNVMTLDLCSKDRSHCQYECTNRASLNDASAYISTDVINVTRLDMLPQLPFVKEHRSPCFVTKRSPGFKTTSETRIRCLPYFFLAGFPKTGTTDLYQRMSIHKDIHDPIIKEPHWWSNPKRPTFLSYINYFYVNSNTGNLVPNNKTSIDNQLFGDFSTREFLDENHPGYWSVKSSTLYKLKAVLPCARFIVMLRDPVERLYSDYLYFSGRQYSSSSETDMTKITPRDFHKKCLMGIHWWKVCLIRHQGDVRNCLHRISTKGMPDLNRSHNKCWSNSNYTCKAFKNGLYYYYVRDWLEIFPKSHFKFIRLEDYSRNKIGTVNDILHFLGARPLNNLEEQVVKRMARQVPGGAKLRYKYPPMMEETRKLLTEFYKEPNTQLAKLLGDDNLLKMWQT